MSAFSCGELLGFHLLFRASQFGKKVYAL